MEVSNQEWYTLEDYAKRLSIASRSLKEAIDKGRIPAKAVSEVGIGGRGGGKKRILIHKPTADAAWVETENLTSKRTAKAKAAVERIRAELEANGTTANLPDTEQSPVSETTSGGHTTFNEALRREKVAKAAMAHLQFLEKQGTLVKKDAVYNQLFEAGQMLRDKIMAIPNRITSEIAACNGDSSKIRNILTEELASTLEEMHDIYNKKLG